MSEYAVSEFYQASMANPVALVSAAQKRQAEGRGSIVHHHRHGEDCVATCEVFEVP